MLRSLSDGGVGYECSSHQGSQAGGKRLFLMLGSYPFSHKDGNKSLPPTVQTKNLLQQGPVSHEQKLSQSLEIALTSTLGSMPSFTSRLTRGQLQHLSTRGGSISWRPGTSSEQSGSSLGPECTSCKRVFSPYFKREPAYQLPCGHLLCRPCLSEKQRSPAMTCTACQQPFASQDILRVHF